MIACGTGAGAGLVEGLKAVEKVARGAIGGFVSFVAVGDGNTMVRKPFSGAERMHRFQSQFPPRLRKRRSLALSPADPTDLNRCRVSSPQNLASAS